MTDEHVVLWSQQPNAGDSLKVLMDGGDQSVQRLDAPFRSRAATNQWNRDVSLFGSPDGSGQSIATLAKGETVVFSRPLAVNSIIFTATHQGYARVNNGWGEDLQSITLRHRRGNDHNREESKTWRGVKAGDWTPENDQLEFTYETGAFSPYDYWWVKLVTFSGSTYMCKDNFYCSVSSDDDGKVKAKLDGAEKEMHITFSYSSGCDVSLTKQT